MLTQVKNILILSALASSLAACSTTNQPMGGMSGMKMDTPMCKKSCECCKMMQGQEDMRTSGMMTGSGMKPMMCMPPQETEKKIPVKKTAPKPSPKPDAEHKEHHPDNTQ